MALMSSPHGLVVSPEARGKGVGAALLARTYGGERHLLLLGAGKSVQRTYVRMGAELVPTFWHRTFLNPMTAPVIVGLHRLSPSLVDRGLALACSVANAVRTRGAWLDVHHTVSRGLASEIADLLVRDANGDAHVAWTWELVHWRFFAHSGPRHIVVRSGAGPGRDPRAFAIVSLGIQRSLLVARTVEWYAEDDRAARRLAISLRALLTAMGANAWLAMTSRPARAQQWQRLGFWPAPNAPMAYQLHQPRGTSFGSMAFGGGAGDYGFEAIPLGAV
jgi:hypothetical protein